MKGCGVTLGGGCEAAGMGWLGGFCGLAGKGENAAGSKFAVLRNTRARNQGGRGSVNSMPR